MTNNYAIQTVNEYTGKVFWLVKWFSTMDEAMTHIQKRCNEDRRILIWRERNQ